MLARIHASAVATFWLHSDQVSAAAPCAVHTAKLESLKRSATAVRLRLLVGLSASRSLAMPTIQSICQSDCCSNAPTARLWRGGSIDIRQGSIRKIVLHFPRRRDQYLPWFAQFVLSSLEFRPYSLVRPHHCGGRSSAGLECVY